MHGLMRLAALTGISGVIRNRLAAGDDVNATDPQGRTALMLAARRGHLEACRSLLEAGADVSCTSVAGDTALLLATAAGHSTVVRLLHDYALHNNPPIGEPLNEAGIDVPANLEEDEVSLQGWIAYEDGPAPEPDGKRTDAAADVRLAISAHSPIDRDEDWSDADLSLPELPGGRARRLSTEESGFLCSVIAHGLTTGSVSGRLLDDIASGELPMDLLDQDPDLARERADHLRIVLGELDVHVDDDEPRSMSCPIMDSGDEAPEQVTEALEFLTNLASRHNDPSNRYTVDLNRGPPLLTAADEAKLGKTMAEARSRVAAAISKSDRAIAILLDLMEAGDPASTGEDHDPIQDAEEDEGEASALQQLRSVTTTGNAASRTELVALLERLNPGQAEIAQV